MKDTSGPLFHTCNDVRAPQAHAHALPPEEAQQLCNCVLFDAHWPGAREDVAARSCRPEAIPGRLASHKAFATEWTIANPSSYRTEYALADGTRFRVKQFLFDWAPPFAGQPNLWNHPSTAHPLKSGDLVWIGTDYKGAQGAYAELARTSVELSVTHGTMSEADIVAFYQGLRVVSPGYAARHAMLPLHRIGYWQRFRPRWLKVPFSLWKPVPFGAYAIDDWVDPTDEALHLVVRGLFPVRLDGYRPETLGFRVLGAVNEILDLKFQCEDDPMHGMRIYYRRTLKDDAKPAEPAQEFCQTAPLPAPEGLTCDLASISAAHGPFEYRVQDTRRKSELIVMFTPFSGHTRDGCDATVAAILDHLSS